MAMKKIKSAPVGVIDKVLIILELLDKNPDGLKLGEIAGQSKINKSTAHRFLSHLEAQKYRTQAGKAWDWTQLSRDSRKDLPQSP
jgi:DNA-binding IclR family transcriptional regulator